MKNYDTFLLGVYAAMFEDIAAWYPEGATQWLRAQARLRFLVKTRGVRFLTVDLVAAGKHFDLCLEAGAYIPSKLPCQAARKGVAIPHLFEGMLRKVFTLRSGKLRDDADINAILILRQLYFAAKKVRMVADDSSTFSTVKEFFDIEKEVRSPTLHWADDRIFTSDEWPDISISDLAKLGNREQPDLFGDQVGDGEKLLLSYPGLLETIQRTADVVSSGLGFLDPTEITPRHGPGAVSDRDGESKYDFPFWPGKLSNLFDAGWHAFYNESAIISDELDGGPLLSRGEPPSKLIAVPKTQKAPRLIASEPTAHQWIQQGILSTLIERMDKTPLRNCISIRDQLPSRNLALDASIHRHLSTIDLSSASDRVSCWLVERIFRSNRSFLLAFHACRTRWLINVLDKKSPKYTVLRKFTTMGSALTFPVQSIVYAICCIGVDIYMRNAVETQGLFSPLKDLSRVTSGEFSREVEKSSRRVRVFGDDLIHPVDSTYLLVEVLTNLGLKVNIHKTFTASFFRESCGLDAYRGVDVTPCYVNEVPCDTEPESLVSVVESSNNLFLKGWWKTSDFLRRSLPRRVSNSIAVKGVGSGAFGFTSFVGKDVTHLKRRWNTNLHHEECLALIPISRNKRKGIRGGAALLQYFTELPEPTTKWTNGVGLRTPLQLKRMGVPTNTFD